jgi:hypothetical protein
MRVLLPLDQRLQSEEKDEADADNYNNLIAKFADDELERKPSPVYTPVGNDTIIYNPELIAVGDHHSTLSKQVEFTTKTEVGHREH